MNEKELTFDLERETKGALRYQERGSAVVGTLYIRKEALGNEKPKVLVMTLRVGS